MPTESGYSNQKKLGIAQFKTIQALGSERYGTVSGNTGLSTVTSGITIDSATESLDGVTVRLEIPGHGARKNDIIRILDGVNAGFEVSVDLVVDANNVDVLNAFPSPLAGDGSESVLTMRWVTLQLDSGGNIVVAPPVGGATEAKQDLQIIQETAINTKLALLAKLTDTQPVSAASLPLPSGAATSANQSTSNTSLSSIDTKLSSQATAANQTSTNTKLDTLISQTPATLGQKASVASMAVVLSSEQEAEIGIVTETAPASDTASSGLNGRLQRIAQRLTSLIALLPTSLGQKTMAQSLAVTLASDQSALAVTTSVTDATASGNITTQNLVPAGTATAGSAVAISYNGVGVVVAQVTGTYTGALSAQATVDGSTWVTLSGLLNVNTGALSATITSATTGIFQIQAAGYAQVRITGLAAMTGTAVVSLRAPRTTGLVGVSSPLPAGANIIGALSANQSSNISQINAVAPLMGNGVTGTGSLRVTIASDTSANTNPYLVSTRKAAVTAKQATVTAGLTAIRATTDNLAPSATRQILRVFVDPDTAGATAKFYVGSSTVTISGATKGEQIYPGAAWVREDDANDWYIISDTASQPVAIVEAE